MWHDADKEVIKCFLSNYLWTTKTKILLSFFMYDGYFGGILFIIYIKERGFLVTVSQPDLI